MSQLSLNGVNICGRPALPPSQLTGDGKAMTSQSIGGRGDHNMRNVVGGKDVNHAIDLYDASGLPPGIATSDTGTHKIDKQRSTARVANVM